MKIWIKDLKTSISDMGRVTLSFDCSRKALGEIEKLKNGEYELSIKKVGNKRTAAQNRYLWELIGQICVKENGNRADDEEIYIQLLEQAGVKCEYIMGLPEIEMSLRRAFRSVKIVDHRDYNGKGMNVYKVFFGSSTMDTKEMASLIDKTIERAEADGIDTDYWRRMLCDTM